MLVLFHYPKGIVSNYCYKIIYTPTSVINLLRTPLAIDVHLVLTNELTSSPMSHYQHFI